MLKLVSTLTLLVLVGLAQAQSLTFGSAASYATGSSYIYNLAVADLNGDGKIDVVTANGGSNNVGVLLGTSNGLLQSVVTYDSGPSSGPADVQIADVNGDGKLDLLTANSSTSALGVLLGNGNGTFQTVATYPGQASGLPTGLAVADLNGDGKVDAALINSLSNSASVLLGNGNGTFQAAVHYNIPTGGGWGDAKDITIGDINGDSKLDLLTAHLNTSTIGVLLGNGNGTFQPATILTTGTATRPTSIALADVNGDSRLDVLTANYGNATAGVLLATSTGTLSAIATYPVATGSNLNDLTVVDITNDGNADLLITTATSLGAFTLLAGNGNGTFRSPVSHSASTSTNGQSKGIAVADLNSDGKLDVLITNSTTNTLSVLLNTTLLSTRSTLPGATASVWPNPIEGSAPTLTLAGLPATVDRVQVNLLDATGRTVEYYTLPIAQGAAQARMPTTKLVAGLYVLRLSAIDARGIVLGTLPVQHLSLQ